MILFFKGCWLLVRNPRFFLKVWRDAYQKLKDQQAQKNG